MKNNDKWPYEWEREENRNNKSPFDYQKLPAASRPRFVVLFINQYTIQFIRNKLVADRLVFNMNSAPIEIPINLN